MTGRWVLAGSALAIVAGVASSALPFSDQVPPPQPPVQSGPVRLVAFDSCENALSELRRAAAPHVTAYGFGGGNYAAADSSAGRAVSQAASAAEKAAPPEPSHSQTNTHEQGVDEPDLVKTDGKRIVSITDGKLRVVDVASRAVTGTLAFSSHPSQLLVHGDRALVVVSGGGFAEPIGKPVPPVRPDMPYVSGTELVLVDLAGAPRIISTLKTDSVYVDARQVGGTARVVVRSTPRLPFVYPQTRGGELDSFRQNREILATAPIDAWLPRYELDASGARSSGTLVDCAKISHPAVHSATSMLTVLTFDMPRDLGTGQPVSILADGDTVYGTDKSLYVADDHKLAPQRPTASPVPGPVTTAIHQFDVSKPGPPVHVASGEVGGTLLNQYALSEFEGHLRVATTTGTEVPCCWRTQGERIAPDQPAAPPPTQSSVTVLARQDRTLAQVGRVDGLGKGERIRGVRFAGRIGYVVTFRQTDPLYTIDLTNPRAPRTVGELKITGYSAYLHPIGDGKLIGVGQEATDQGRATGTQVSLFDVSNLATPRRLAQHHLPNSNSEAEFDPHAFLYWPADGTVVIPVMSYDQASTRGAAASSLVLRVRDGNFEQVGTLQQPAGASGYFDYGARRALVIGDQLWTVTAAGAMANSLNGLAQQAWVPFS